MVIGSNRFSQKQSTKPHFEINKMALLRIKVTLLLWVGVAFGRPFSLNGLIYNHEAGLSLTLDPYRSFFNVYTALVKSPPVSVYTPDEFVFYRNILRDARYPTHLLVELTGYPIAWMTAELRKYHPALYERFYIWKDINILSSLAGDQREPYSVSLFLGQICRFIYLDDEENVRYGSGGIYGFVLTTGWYEIFDDYPCYARWYRLEWKLKGGLAFGDILQSWEIKAGYRWYGLKWVDDDFFVVFRREKFLPGVLDWGINRNSSAELAWHLPPADLKGGLSYCRIAFGKVVPVKKYLVGTSLGLSYERRRRCDRTTNGVLSPTKQVTWSFIFQPILVW